MLETSILLMVIVFAFLAMNTYLKRGLQGRLRSNVDSIGEQYDPKKTVSDFVMNQASNVTTTSTTAEQDGIRNPWTGATDKRLITTVLSQTHYDNSTRTGDEVVGGF